jgi:Transposase
VSEYAGKQFVGVDLHRRRTVLVRTTDAGEVLESVRISNDVESLNLVMARAGVDPEVVLEATYGWYWAVEALQKAGANVHLAHPLGVKAFEYRRVKNDERDAKDLADLLRMVRLPEAWIAPPETRELRELVRHRAKLVGIRSHCKAEVHAVLAKCGVQVNLTDLFGVGGLELLDRLATQRRLPTPYASRVSSLRRLIEDLDFEIDLFAGIVRGRLARDPGYVAVQQIPGIGPILGAVFVAEVGDVSRAVGLLGRTDPQAPRVRHPRAPGPDHQAGLTPGPLGRGGVGPDAARAHQGRCRPGPGRGPPRPQRRGGGRRPGPDRAGLLRTSRPPRAGTPPATAPSTGRLMRCQIPRSVAGRAGHDPRLNTTAFRGEVAVL